MILFLVALKSLEHYTVPRCALDALMCAKRFSGCEVVALTDMPTEGWQDVGPYMASSNAFKEELVQGLKQPLHRFFPMSARYFIMQEYITAHSLTGPIFNCDWDILVFSDLPEHFKSVGGLDTDICSCMIRTNQILQAPMLISNLGAIKYYVDQLTALLKTQDHNNIFLCDITQWADVRKKGGFTDSRSCSLPYRDTYFDPNSGMDDDVFQFQNSSKKIEWKDNLPYFVRNPTGELVRAIAIHTFMSWRHRTPELMANL